MQNLGMPISIATFPPFVLIAYGGCGFASVIILVRLLYIIIDLFPDPMSLSKTLGKSFL